MINIIKKGVKTQDHIFQVGLKKYLRMKEDKPNVDGSANPKVRHLQQSTLSWKATFKGPMTRLEDKVYDFVKQKHDMGFLEN